MRVSWLMALALVVGAQAAVASPMELTMEGRMGPYVPDTRVDLGTNALDLANGGNPFNCTMGFGVRPMAVVSPQLSVFDLFGTALIGVEAGIYNVSGRTLTTASDCNSNNGLTRNELTLAPVFLTATYRFDWALDRFAVPLVPYIRAGVGGTGYVITQDGQFVRSNSYEETVNGTVVKQRRDPAGISLGGKAALGLMLALDFLEPLRALRARAKGVYKHTYLFAEMAFMDAGAIQNEVLKRAPTNVQSYLGPTLVVGAERLPMFSLGLAIAF